MTDASQLIGDGICDLLSVSSVIDVNVEGTLGDVDSDATSSSRFVVARRAAAGL
jgi:hypothetical protein